MMLQLAPAAAAQGQDFKDEEEHLRAGLGDTQVAQQQAHGQAGELANTCIGVDERPGAVTRCPGGSAYPTRTSLLFHTISDRPPKQPHMESHPP